MQGIARMLLVAQVLLAYTGCQDDPARPFVTLDGSERRVPEAPWSPAEQARGSEADPLRIGLGAMVTPREGFKYYRHLVDLLHRRLGRQIQLVDRIGYEAMNEDLRSGRIDVAFVCSRPYVEGKEAFGLELLAAPVVDGATVYYSCIIVRQDLPCRALADLRGRSFAYTDPLSNTGHSAPRQALRAEGHDPEAFFGNVIFSGSHDVSIRAVAQGLVDAAAVDSLVLEYLGEVRPEAVARCRVIAKLGPYGIPPIVARPGLPADIRDRIRSALLSLHEDPEGVRILKALRIERFVQVEDSLYDSIRQQREPGRARGAR